jgi:hypothetical protein
MEITAPKSLPRFCDEGKMFKATKLVEEVCISARILNPTYSSSLFISLSF